MTPEQEAQLERIKGSFCARVDVKYRAGVAEHLTYLGDLTELALVEHAIGEALDEFCYLSALREKLLARKAGSVLNLCCSFPVGVMEMAHVYRFQLTTGKEK
jgi:hypothetical protein